MSDEWSDTYDDPPHPPKCLCYECERDREDMYGDWLRDEQIDREIEQKNEQ